MSTPVYMTAAAVAKLQKPPQSQPTPRRQRAKAKAVIPPTPIFEVFEGGCRVEVPLPASAISVNNKDYNHRPKATATRQFRLDCKLLFAEVFRRRNRVPFKRIRLSYTWYMAPSVGDGLYRPKDKDNAISALKACQDAIWESNLIADDTADTVTLGEVLLLRTASEHGGRRGVLVWVEEVRE